MGEPGRSLELIFLQPLSDDDSGRLIESLLDGGSLDTAARERIVEAPDGLPLFVEEMVAMLIDEGALRRDNGRWVGRRSLADRSSGDHPGAARISSRPARSRERAVLERGSVEGQVFHRSAVEYLWPDSERPGVGTAVGSSS